MFDDGTPSDCGTPWIFFIVSYLTCEKISKSWNDISISGMLPTVFSTGFRTPSSGGTCGNSLVSNFL